MNHKLFLVAAAMVPLLALSPVSPAMAKTKSSHGGAATHQVKHTHKKSKRQKTKKSQTRSVLGTINTITDTGFTVNAGKRGTFSVEVSDQTQYVGPKKSALSLSELQTGMRVVVKGNVNAKDKTVSAVTQVRELGASKKKTAAEAANGNGQQDSDGDQDATNI